MFLQMPDHTKQIFPPIAELTARYCSITRSGSEQQWTIYSVNLINR